MINPIRRVTRLGAIVGLTAVVVVGLGAPASAATNENQAFGIRVTGPIVTAGPFSAASFNDGPFSDTLVSAAVTGILTSGTLNTTASATDATASVQDLSVTLVALTTFLNATAVSSECSYDPGSMALTGSTSIVGGTVVLPLLPDITLATSPAANTGVSVLGVTSIILNRQVTNPDGSLTVDAIFIELIDGTQIRIATSHCHPEELAIPTVAPVFAIGAGALAILAGGFLVYRRRHSAAIAA